MHIRVVEGYVDTIEIEGALGGDGLVKRIAEKITSGRPLKATTLERYTLLLNDLPGLKAETVLEPSATSPGAATLVVSLVRKPVSFSGSLDNRGSQAIGPVEATAGASFNSLLGLNERTDILLATAFPTRSLQYISLRHDLPIGREGVRPSLSGSYSASRPGNAIGRAVFARDGKA